jgi:uncharacterized membrane protein YqhA
LRLIASLPVLMSLASSAIPMLAGGASGQYVIARLLGGVVSGIDVSRIGIALLIFGYGLHELLISPIEETRESGGGSGLLDCRNRDQRRETLVKVLVVALSGVLVRDDPIAGRGQRS